MSEESTGVGLAVLEDDPDADDREADEPALLQDGPEPLVAGRDELPGDAPALDLVDELVDALGAGLDRPDDAAELAGAARLLLVGVVELRLLADGLAVGDLGLPGLDLGPVFPLHPLDDRRRGGARPCPG